MDFLRITTETTKKGFIKVLPEFIVSRSKDLMIRGKSFYAIWDEDNKRWATDQGTAVRMIDNEIISACKAIEANGSDRAIPMLLRNSSSGMIDRWKHYCKDQMEDNYITLNSKLIFANDEPKRELYSSHRLPYSLEEGDYSAYDELMTVLYSPEERMKLEWAIGAVVTGDSKKIQKFIVLTGDAGTGKSTVIKIINRLFQGYTAAIDAKAIGSSQAAFALEPLRDNPLIAYQDDADLTKISDNTRLNSLVSHERMTINEKYKAPYETSYICFIFLGSNGEVNITDARSGLQRRLIDVRPTGFTLPIDKYYELMEKIEFELGAIAYHCKEVYLNNKHKYDKYKPTQSLRSTNPFYGFLEENYFLYKDRVDLNTLWSEYNKYCDDGGFTYRLNKAQVKREAMAYFSKFVVESRDEKGSHLRNIFYNLKPEKFGMAESEVKADEDDDWLDLKEMSRSTMEVIFSECPAQYANDEDKPIMPWDKVETKLADIDPMRTHYIRLPNCYVTIDFDKKDKDGKKSFALNKKAALKWPKTYAELSKGGEGIHLVYKYAGDVSMLSYIYEEDVEIKLCLGKASIRRRLSKCNNLPIATINSGLPLKGGKDMVNFDAVKSEKALRTIIKDCLEKKHHGATKPEVDFIFKVLDDAYTSGLHYDVTDLRPAILAFANNSTNQALTCIKMVNKMKFHSEEISDNSEVISGNKAYFKKPIIFYDVEVFPNLFIVCWKKEGSEATVISMINPNPSEIEKLITDYRLIGFNNRRYDNHIMYARMMGYTESQLFDLSQRIISGSKNAMFGEAYNLSYTDIYDFCSKKQSLKKWEIELGIHHQELGLPWDLPVPEEMWDLVASYCKNDVIATEAVWNDRQEDFIAREILSDISGLTVNDTTNQQTAKIIFGNDKNPQSKFVYTDLSEMFPGYKYEFGHSTYRGEDPGEGGYVYSRPGMYGNVALLDIASMHPTSIEQLNLFGPYTKNFSMLKQARIYIKHHDYESAGKMFDGKLKPYLKSDDQAKALSYALKIVINSVYGLTSAKFDNKFKDPRNVDNIVAKRGALFMINLKHEVQKRGYIVAHIKTDSIKIPDATPEIIQFVMDYGKQYGYIFEHEATYEKMCLVNDAVYIAKYKDGPHWDDDYKKELWWTATGTQFKVPYVFKTLFIKEPIEFKDLCETRTVSTALYLDMNEGLSEDEHKYVFVGKAGQFCPIKTGCGGGILLREKEGNYNSAPNSKGFRWLESEVVRNLHKEADIDMEFYKNLVDAAVHDISEWGDFEWFVSDDPYSGSIDIPITASKEIESQIKELKGEDEPLPFN